MMCPNCADSVMNQLDENQYYCESCGLTIDEDGESYEPEFIE